MLSFVAPSMIVLLLSGCATTSHWQLAPAPAEGLPEFFIASGGEATPAGAACRNPLRDPRNNTILTLVRSGSSPGNVVLGWGDYAVSPAGRYGVGEDRLLRVECASGRPLGAVPRKG